MSHPPPSSATGAAVDLDATTVDEQGIWSVAGARQRTENAFPVPRSDQQTNRL